VKRLFGSTGQHEIGCNLRRERYGEIIRAFQIARREWGNIMSSLEVCGDIEEFNSENPISSRIAKIEDSRPVENLIRMENERNERGSHNS
jgi:hypothetical protein